MYSGIAIFVVYTVAFGGAMLWQRYGDSDAEGTPPEPREGINRWKP